MTYDQSRPSTVYRPTYNLGRRRRPKAPRTIKERPTSHTALVFTERCEHGHALDPLVFQNSGKCRVCMLVDSVPKNDAPPEPDGDWRFWPIDCLPGFQQMVLARLAKRFMYVGELRGLDAQTIAAGSRRKRTRLALQTAERIVATVRCLVNRGVA